MCDYRTETEAESIDSKFYTEIEDADNELKEETIKIEIKRS